MLGRAPEGNVLHRASSATRGSTKSTSEAHHLTRIELCCVFNVPSDTSMSGSRSSMSVSAPKSKARMRRARGERAGTEILVLLVELFGACSVMQHAVKRRFPTPSHKLPNAKQQQRTSFRGLE
eukprot:3936162-Rhodomonas_salina.1